MVNRRAGCMEKPLVRWFCEGPGGNRKCWKLPGLLDNDPNNLHGTIFVKLEGPIDSSIFLVKQMVIELTFDNS